MVKDNNVILAGEITSNADLNYEAIARQAIREIGYTDPTTGFDAETCNIQVLIGKQSNDIALGVDKSATHAQGSGDQGLIFGYATNETANMMPAEIAFAHAIGRLVDMTRRRNLVSWLRPDLKTQVTLERDRVSNKVIRVHTVVLSTSHTEDVTIEELRETMKALIQGTEPWSTPRMDPVLEKTLQEFRDLLDLNTIWYINPTGRFIIHGPVGDSGVTGRKIIVDSYGGVGHHGGGAFSGKDSSKVDRSAAYMGRYITKNIVAAGLADRCEIQLAYAIGVAQPVSICVDTFGTANTSTMQIADFEKILEKAVKVVFDCSPEGIIDTLDLKRPIYRQTTDFGHFGKEGLPWERCDKVSLLKATVDSLLV
jgi:S-adenosylmethionine synthetase